MLGKLRVTCFLCGLEEFSHSNQLPSFHLILEVQSDLAARFGRFRCINSSGYADVKRQQSFSLIYAACLMFKDAKKWFYEQILYTMSLSEPYLNIALVKGLWFGNDRKKLRENGRMMSLVLWIPRSIVWAKTYTGLFPMSHYK